ncbi:unnamed protein product [Cylicocyclus nassatus]|uniref:ribonuclease H n=1 Tax=Cylicocyclus nassatus TaxID=53992 RepID=A0AA36DNX3_CYLNA|nr:unnamed protein product [Cylicocyclus nassatus]
MWNAVARNGSSLQRLNLLRSLATAGPATIARPTAYHRINSHAACANNRTLTLRATAGRSSPSVTPPPRSWESSNSSQTDGSVHKNGSRTERSSSLDEIESSDFGAQSSMDDGYTRKSILLDASRSQNASSTAGISSSETMDSNRETRDSNSIIPSSTSESFGTNSGSSGTGSAQRQSRWEAFQTDRNLGTRFGPQEFTTVSVKQNKDPVFLNYDHEFAELKRDKSPNMEWNKRFPEGTIVVYTDGSCIDNRASGFGVYFGPNHELNRSERIIGPIHNSGLAEILGAQTALRSLRNWRGYRNEAVILRTDFLPLVTAMSGGASDGRFGEEMEKVRSLAAKFPKGVQFQHVYAHDGDPGNEQADALARMATAEARRARSASVSRDLFEPDGTRRGRSVSRNRGFRGRSRSRNISWNRNRLRSRSNNRYHIRSHSAFVAGRRR